MSDAARVKSTIFVGGLHPTVHAKILHDAFIPFGEIADISLPKPEAPNSQEMHRGFGYIEYAQAPDAAEAVDNMDQSVLFGRVIKVAPAKPSQAAHLNSAAGGDRDGVLGSKTALWEQEGYLSRLEGRGETLLTAAEDGQGESADEEGPMNGLQGLDVAGPKKE